MNHSLSELEVWLARSSGVEPRLLRNNAFAQMIGSRLEQLGLSDINDYVTFLRCDAAEHERLLAEISVPETYFFRYPSSLEYLRGFLSQRRREAERDSPLRILSLGCATGEEAVSLVATAHAATWPWEQIHVRGIDRSSASVERARNASFSRWSLRGPVPRWAAGWLRTADGRTLVDQRVMDRLTFRCGDVLNDSLGIRPQEFDIIACRNLLIYLHQEAQQRVVESLSVWLKRDGLILLGHADPTKYLNAHFRRSGVEASFAWQPLERSLPDPSVWPIRPVAAGIAPLAPPTRATDDRFHDRASWPRMDKPGAESPSPPQFGSDPADALNTIRTLADTGDLESAAAACQQLLQACPDWVDALSLHGDILLALGRFEAANQAFRKALYVDPQHEASLLQMSCLLRRSGHAAEAERYALRAAQRHRSMAEE